MKPLTAPKPFSSAAIDAFPYEYRAIAEAVARELTNFVDDEYRKPSTRMQVARNTIYIPRRLHFLSAVESANFSERAAPFVKCLLTRSTDGYLRQRALKSILNLRQPWIVPFVVPLVGEYVVEILEDIQSALPSLDQGLYSNFVRENRDVMRLIRSRAASYWDEYYRERYPDRAAYPGLLVLRRLEEWAS